MTGGIDATLEQIYREEWARVLAVTIRQTRDVALAEDLVQETFLRAMPAWERDGVPPNPGAWLITTARNIGRDGYRRRQVLSRKLPLLVIDAEDDDSGLADDAAFGDERLRLIFTCCHPALAMPARVALSLRLVCGLSTETIAGLFLVQPTTMAARLTRARHKIQAAGIPYRVPTAPEMDARVRAVLAVIYLVYTEGHTAGLGESLRRPDLARLASDLVQVMRDLLPDNAEVMGLSALIRLTEARQGARFAGAEGVVLLEAMDRSRWDRAEIAVGLDLVRQALRVTDRERPGPYVLQAAIAALHAEADSYAETDWVQVAGFYALLMRTQPTPVFALGRALALGMVHGPDTALVELDRLEGTHPHPMLPAARADVLRRAGRNEEAADAYLAAASLMTNDVMARDFRARAARVRLSRGSE